MSELSIKITGEEADLISRLVNVVRHVKQSDEAFAASASTSEKAASAAREAARQQATLANEGKRIADNLRKQNENLTDSYERQSKALHLAHEKNRIDADQLKTALAQLEKQHEEQAEANRRAAVEASEAWQTQQREVREGIAVIDRLTAKNKTVEQQHIELKAKIKAAWEAGKISSRQYADGLLQVDAELDAIKHGQQEVGEKNDVAFGEGALKKVTAIAASYLSVQTAINLATRALEAHNEERNKGRSETERLQDSRRRLFQISSSGEDFNQLEARADAAAGKFGVDRGLARQVLFTARSEGFENEYEQVLKLSPVIDPQSAGTVAGQVRELFKKENVDVTGAIAAVLEGARSSRVDFEGITRALPQVGEGGRAQGAGIDESIAGVSVLASVFKSGETTGDRLKAFLSALSLNDATKGKGLIGGFEALQSLPEEDRKKFLGSSQELNAVYSALKDTIGDVKTRRDEVREARLSSDPKFLKAFEENGRLTGFQKAEAAKVQQQIAEENAFSANKSKNTELIAAEKARSINAGETGTGRFISGSVESALDFLGADVGKARASAAMEAARLFSNPLGGGKLPGENFAADLLSGKFEPGEDPQMAEQNKLIKEFSAKLDKPPLITRPGEDK